MAKAAPPTEISNVIKKKAVMMGGEYSKTVPAEATPLLNRSIKKYQYCKKDKSVFHISGL
jgi:hypothetical protein